VSQWISALSRRVDPRLVVRAVSLFLALGTGAVLALAIWLSPDPAGHGTHMQLGLNNCTFLSLTGYPCPMCGATTTFALWAHLRPVAALINQPFASLLFWLTAATFGISVFELVRPGDRWARILRAAAPWEGPLAAGFLALMFLSWIYKIWLMG
jgi:hypothetical protein